VKARINLLRGPISHLRSSPYLGTVPVLGATSGRSLRLLHAFTVSQKQKETR